jgi:hypothetical protein
MDERLEPDWNVIVEREEQDWKQDWPIVSTVEGMQMDDNDEQFANAKSSIRVAIRES